MNTRQKKKAFKKKYKISHLPKGFYIKAGERLVKEIRDELARQIKQVVRVNTPAPSGLREMWEAHMRGEDNETD